MKKKVGGYALLETSIALVMIVICVGFSLQHMSSMLNSDTSAMKVKSQQAFRQMLEERDLVDKSKDFEGITVYQNVSPYPNSDNVVLVEFEAMDNEDKVILTSKHLVRLNEED